MGTSKGDKVFEAMPSDEQNYLPRGMRLYNAGIQHYPRLLPHQRHLSFHFAHDSSDTWGSYRVCTQHSPESSPVPLGVRDAIIRVIGGTGSPNLFESAVFHRDRHACGGVQRGNRVNHVCEKAMLPRLSLDTYRRGHGVSDLFASARAIRSHSSTANLLFYGSAVNAAAV